MTTEAERTIFEQKHRTFRKFCTHEIGPNNERQELAAMAKRSTTELRERVIDQCLQMPSG